MSANPIQVFQFTDTHLNADAATRMYGVNTFDTFGDTVDLALAQYGKPDFVLLTGDISQDESIQSYEHAYQIASRIGAPVFSLPGNHDCPDTMLERLASCAPPMKSERSFEYGPWQIILLDSTIPHKVEGDLNEGEMVRLADGLKNSLGRHVLVCLHHNPVSVGSPAFGEIGLGNADEFFKIIDGFASVRGILFGHIHQEFLESRNGVQLMGSPSTCFQFKPRSAVFGLDALPPGFRRLQLFADGRIETSVSRLPALPDGLILSSKTS